jgi:hypothetical protein
MLFVSLVLVIFLQSASSNFHSVSDCDDRFSNCVAFYCNQEANWTVAEEKGPEKCNDPEKLTGKFEEIFFVRASDFPNDSSTGKFIRELESRNDSIRRKVLSEQHLSHLMEHKLQLIVNGVWLEHNAKDSLFPIVSTRNSTGNELEVLYLDCSLADINLQFLDLFDFTSSFVFWCYVVEGIGLIILIGMFIKEQIGCPDDIDDVLFLIFYTSLGLSHISWTFYFLPTFFAVYLNFSTHVIWTSLILCL